MRKVFGIGLSRTGTTTLTTALQKLGYQALHFPSDEATQTEFYGFFSSGSQLIKLSALEHYDAITDTPVCCMFKALDRSYPDARFILTIREKESWLKSCEKHWNEFLPLLLRISDPAWSTFAKYISKLLYGTANYDRAMFAQAYDRYHTEVFQYFKQRSEDLLVLNVVEGEGWEKLATFLGKAVPDEPFPIENRMVRKRTGLKTAYLSFVHCCKQLKTAKASGDGRLRLK